MHTAVGLAALAAAAAQEPIRVSTRLIEVNVVAHDSHGAVSGLKESDFKLFDNGKPQRIRPARLYCSSIR